MKKETKFMTDNKRFPNCTPTSDAIVNWYLKLSTRVEIFGLSIETLLEYSSNSGTHVHPYYWYWSRFRT